MTNAAAKSKVTMTLKKDTAIPGTSFDPVTALRTCTKRRSTAMA